MEKKTGKRFKFKLFPWRAGKFSSSSPSHTQKERKRERERKFCICIHVKTIVNSSILLFLSVQTAIYLEEEPMRWPTTTTTKEEGKERKGGKCRRS